MVAPNCTLLKFRSRVVDRKRLENQLYNRSHSIIGRPP
jgi:hypothetical protein